MLKRRLKDAGLFAFSPHSFWATGITNFLENGGTPEVAQRIAGHADSRTTKLTTDVGRGFTRRHGADSILISKLYRTGGLSIGSIRGNTPSKNRGIVGEQLEETVRSGNLPALSAGHNHDVFHLNIRLN
jgi:hypothetical protein